MQMLTSQEILNKAYAGVYVQGCQSFQEKKDGGLPTFCAYRGVNGAKCAAGHLISDEAYRPFLERKVANNPHIITALLKSGVDMLQHGEMVLSIQREHDNMPSDKSPDEFRAYWTYRIGLLANRYGLAAPDTPTLPTEAV